METDNCLELYYLLQGCRKCKHLSKGNRGVCVSDCTCNNYDKYEEVD